MPESPTAERREQMLGLLAEKTLALACEVQERALAAETAGEIATLSNAFVRLARATRQCIALYAREERTRLRGEDDGATAAAEARAKRVSARKDRVTRAVGRALDAQWRDGDDDDDQEVLDARREALDARCEDLSEEEDFLDLDPDVLIARLCEELGVEPLALLRPAARPARAGLGVDGAQPDGQEPGAHAPPNTS